MMRKTKSNKKLLDEESESSISNNAFAAAMDQALNDDGDEDDGIFETIQIHDEALASEMSAIESTSRREKEEIPFGLADFPSNRIESGLPTVSELPDRSKQRPSMFKLSSVPAAIGKKWSESVMSNISNSSNERSVYSEANADKPIPTRRLSKSSPSTWKFNAQGDDNSLSSKSSKSSFVSIFERKAERSVTSYQSQSSINSSSVAQMSNGIHSSFSKRSSNLTSTGAMAAMRPSVAFNQESWRSNMTSDSYVVPMPTMQFETRKGALVRVALAIMFFSASLIFTLFLGHGEVGASVTSYLYNNFIVDDEGTFATTRIPNEVETANGAHLFATIERLEGIHSPNVRGNREYHTPKISINDQDIEISIGTKPHVMEEDHYIELVWLKDVTQDKIVLAKEFSPSDESPPTLKARVPHGVTLQPYTFCNSHFLWKGEPFETM